MKTSAFLDADLFVLPTHSESFGMVVAEALAHGLPVLTTTAAPWSILRERGCGWWVDATVDGIAEGLRQATSLDSETLRVDGRERPCISHRRIWLETRRGSHAIDIRGYTGEGAYLSTKQSDEPACVSNGKNFWRSTVPCVGCCVRFRRVGTGYSENGGNEA